MEPSKDLQAQVEQLLSWLRSRGSDSISETPPAIPVLVDEFVNTSHSPHTARLAKLYIEPTNECNLNCRTCVRNVWQEPMGTMSDTVFDRVIEGLRDFSPPPTVFFGGFGEPLFHPKIIEMVSRTKGIGARVEMITNGMLLTSDVSWRLLTAGIDMLWVSLDGTTPESYSDIRLGAELPRVIENVARFRDIVDGGSHPDGCALTPGSSAQLGIEFVAMKRNIGDLPAALILAHQLGAGHFIITNVLPYTEDMIDQVLYSRGLRDNGYPQPSVPKVAGRDVTNDPLATAIHSMKLTLAGTNRQTPYGHCPFIKGESGAIRWDGGLSPCLPLIHSHVSYPVGRERFSRHWTIGNVKERRLADLWNTPEHIAFRERVMAFNFPPCTVCGGCEMSGQNEKDCLLNVFPTCGGCWWAEGAIRCP